MKSFHIYWEKKYCQRMTCKKNPRGAFYNLSLFTKYAIKAPHEANKGGVHNAASPFIRVSIHVVDRYYESKESQSVAFKSGSVRARVNKVCNSPRMHYLKRAHFLREGDRIQNVITDTNTIQSTGLKVFLGSKVLCALFWSLSIMRLHQHKKHRFINEIDSHLW